MLRTFPEHPDTATVDHPHPAATWIDLHDASAADVRLVEQVTGLHVPSRAELEEIESSSRLYKENGALYMSTPVVRPGEDGAPHATPLGFVLTKERLISVRFVDLPAFEGLITRWKEPGEPHESGPEVLADLLDVIVERLADVLERVAGDLDLISHEIFHVDTKSMRRVKRVDDALKAVLQRIGRCGDLASRLRDVLLALGRMVPFVLGTVPSWITPEGVSHFKTIRNDLKSLTDYEGHITNKVQFLLDATLGFINIEQNNIFKILTVFSIVGIPPTLFAGIYGMNFKNIPEYDWSWGYPYGLAVILVSGLLPLIWFKVRGWV